MKVVVANNKGGVGKTTTVVEVAAHAIRLGKKVLLVDTDEQANLTRMVLNEIPSVDSPTLYEALIDGHDLNEVIKLGFGDIWPNTWIIPSNANLDKVDRALAKDPYWIGKLSKLIKRVERNFDLILIDTPPNAGPLTQMSLKAAEKLLIPVDTSVYCNDGIERLLGLVDLLEENGHKLRVSIIPSRREKGGAKAILKATKSLKDQYPKLFKDIDIPNTVKIFEGQQSIPSKPAMQVVEKDHRIFIGYEKVAKIALGVKK